MPKASSIRQARYDATHVKGYHIKLHLENDADIIAVLDSVPNRQAYLKGLIRADISAARTSRQAAAPSADADS